MIRAAILDIDGVILGHKDGVNFPIPSSGVILRLQNLAKTIPVSLCSVKPYFAVQPIIEACELTKWFHITDAGARLVNIEQQLVESTAIGPNAYRFLKELAKTNVFTEWYSGDDYAILSNEHDFLIESRAKLLGKIPVVKSPKKLDPIEKIIVLPLDDIQTTTLLSITQKFAPEIELHWGVNPSRIPKMNAFITNPRATKRTGVTRLAELHQISLTDTLAMGDSLNDWTFMEPCGYVAALANAEPELKELVLARGDHGYVSNKSIDEDGFLAVCSHFPLCYYDAHWVWMRDAVRRLVREHAGPSI